MKIKVIVPVIIGGVIGFLYYKLVGCATGACIISSNPYISTLYGSILGWLISNIFTSKKAKRGDNLTSNEKSPEYHLISGEEAKNKFNNDQDVVLLDVRMKNEYDQYHIEGAILIPYNEISIQAQNILPNKNAIILVYCQSGMRSRKASKELVKMGYTNIYNFGSITNW